MREIFRKSGRNLQQMSRVAKDLYLFMFKTLTPQRCLPATAPSYTSTHGEKVVRERFVL